MDDMEVGIEDLAIDEIRKLLLGRGRGDHARTAEHLARFITQSGASKTH
jgi:hypothetical protein